MHADRPPEAGTGMRERDRSTCWSPLRVVVLVAMVCLSSGCEPLEPNGFADTEPGPGPPDTSEIRDAADTAPIALDVVPDSDDDATSDVDTHPPERMVGAPHALPPRILASGAPWAENDHFEAVGGEVLTLDVLTNDIDPAGGRLTLVDVAPADPRQSIDVSITDDAEHLEVVAPDVARPRPLKMRYTAVTERNQTVAARVTLVVHPNVGLVSIQPQATAGRVLDLELTHGIGEARVYFDGVLAIPDAVVDNTRKRAAYRVPSDLALGPVDVTVRPRDFDRVTGRGSFTVVEPWFEDVSERAGISLEHDTTSPAHTLGLSVGIALGDVDDDGDNDFYLTQLGRPGVLFLNQGDIDGDGVPNFFDATVSAGLELGTLDDGSTASFVDVDNDGDQDLHVGRWGRDTLCLNRLVETGDLRFEDVTNAWGLEDTIQRASGAAWGDYDGDGDLDLYTTSWFHDLSDVVDDGIAQDRLWRNDGVRFTDVTHLLEPAAATRRLTLGAVWFDIERDGDADLLVASDNILLYSTSGPNVLWRNDGLGPDGEWQFTDIAKNAGVDLFPDGKGEGQNAMGIAVGDVDNDGDADFAMSNIGPNALMLNDGTGAFVDQAAVAGVARPAMPWTLGSGVYEHTVTWAPTFFDAENDGDLDLHIAGGSPTALLGERSAPDLFAVQTDRLMFEDRSIHGGFFDGEDALATAAGDLDGDGLIDLVVPTYGGPVRVYLNRMARHIATGHFLRVNVEGRSSNRDGIGAIVERIVIGTDGAEQLAASCFVTSRPSYASAGERTCHFGLGSVTDATGFIRVHWPSGLRSEHSIDAVDTTIVVREP